MKGKVAAAVVILIVVIAAIVVVFNRVWNPTTPKKVEAYEGGAAGEPPRSAVQPIADVRTVRLAVRPDSREQSLVCGEIRMYDREGQWIRPVGGYVSSARPGFSGDWRHLTDDDPKTFVFTDDAKPSTTAGPSSTVAELYYPAGSAGARLVLWSRPDAYATDADRMVNLEVSVITPSGMPFRRSLCDAMATKLGVAQRYYDFDLRL